MVESLSSLLLWSHIFIRTALLLWNTLFFSKACWECSWHQGITTEGYQWSYCQAFQNLIELIVYARPLFQCLIST